jgi:hypothetical protein
MKLIIILTAASLLAGCILPTFPHVPHKHMIPDGAGGYRVYDIE